MASHMKLDAKAFQPEKVPPPERVFDNRHEKKGYAMKKPPPVIADLAKVNALNAQGCAACGRKFELGEPIVMACGAWDGPPRYIHAGEAVFDPSAGTYVERRCFESKKG